MGLEGSRRGARPVGVAGGVGSRRAGRPVAGAGDEPIVVATPHDPSEALPRGHRRPADVEAHHVVAAVERGLPGAGLAAARTRAVGGVEGHPAVAVGGGLQRVQDSGAVAVLKGRPGVRLDVLDDEHVVVAVVVPRAPTILDTDERAGDHLARRVLGLEEADRMALVVAHELVDLGVDLVDLLIGPEGVGRPPVHRHVEPEGRRGLERRAPPRGCRPCRARGRRAGSSDPAGRRPRGAPSGRRT